MISARLPVNKREHQRVALRVFTALDLMVRGMGRREELLDLCDGVNVVEQLCCAKKVEAETMHAVCKAIDGIAKATQIPSGRMRVEGDELEALREVISIYDSMLGRLSQGTIAEAQAAVVVKIVQQRENPDNGVVVIDI